MDKKIQKKLETWLDNDLITEDVFSSIESFESSEPQKTEKGTLSKTIILIGGLLVFSGITPLIGQIPDWAQLILLILFNPNIPKPNAFLSINILIGPHLSG